jgi:hypothetical protein
VKMKYTLGSAAIFGTVLMCGAIANAAPTMMLRDPGGGSGYPEVRTLPPLPPANADPAPYQKWIQRYQASPVKPQFDPPGLHYQHSFP